MVEQQGSTGATRWALLWRSLRATRPSQLLRRAQRDLLRRWRSRTLPAEPRPAGMAQRFEELSRQLRELAGVVSDLVTDGDVVLSGLLDERASPDIEERIRFSMPDIGFREVRGYLSLEDDLLVIEVTDALAGANPLFSIVRVTHTVSPTPASARSSSRAKPSSSGGAAAETRRATGSVPVWFPSSTSGIAPCGSTATPRT